MPAQQKTIFTCDKCEVELDDVPFLVVQTVKSGEPFAQFFCDEHGADIISALEDVMSE